MSATAATWFVMADGARLRIVRRDSANGAFRTIEEAHSKSARLRSSDLGADRPGRVIESASSARHAAGERQDLHRREKRGFAEAIADKLNDAGRRGDFDSLVLVAPDRVLGDIRRHLAADVASKVGYDIAKDLTRVPDGDLASHLSSVDAGPTRGRAAAPSDGGDRVVPEPTDLGSRLQITYRNMDSSPALGERIRKEAEKLSRYFDRITSCHVTVESPHRHKAKGRIFNVRIDLRLPRKGMLVADAGTRDHSHEDVYVALRDAFDATARRLEDHARRLRGDIKASHGSRSAAQTTGSDRRSSLQGRRRNRPGDAPESGHTGRGAARAASFRSSRSRRDRAWRRAR